MMNKETQNAAMDRLFESNLRPAQYWAMKAEDRIKMVLSGQRLGYSTGLKCLDSIMRLRKQELIIIGGHSSMGKTALALQMTGDIVKALKQDGDDGVVAIFSAEMSGESLLMRMATDAAGISLNDFEDRRMGQAELDAAGKRLMESIQIIRTDNFWIDDNSSPTTAQMKAQVKKLTETVPVRAVAFDFLELAGDSDGDNIEQKIAKIGKSLKAMAKELDIPVIALSQLNDDANKRENKIPQSSDLRYSKALQHIADVILLVMRPEYYLEKGIPISGYNSLEEAAGKAVFVVGKQRNGRTGIIPAGYIKEKMRFVDLAQPFGGR